MPRKIYSLMIWLKSPNRIGAIVTPPDNPGGCLRLVNSKRTWLTAKAGDAVLLTESDSSQRYRAGYVESAAVWKSLRPQLNFAIIRSEKVKASVQA